MKMVKTTKRQFEQFKRVFRWYQDLLNMKDWKVFFFHEPLKDGYGHIQADAAFHVARISFVSELSPENVKDLDVIATARHEALHLFNSRMAWMAECRFLMDGEVEQEDERLARSLENVLPVPPREVVNEKGVKP